VADENEIDDRMNEGEFTLPALAYPTDLLQLYEIEFDGEFDGPVELTFGYDPSLLPGGLDGSQLQMYLYQ
jgi:hypothetical protein